MIIFLYGSDEYRLEQYQKGISDRYRLKYPESFSFSVFNMCDGESFEKLSGSVKSTSFFNEHKLLICKNVFRDKDASVKIENLLSINLIADMADTTLVIADGMSEKDLVLKNKNLFKFLSSRSQIIKIFELLDGSKINEWVKAEFSARGCEIENKAASFLVGIVGNESRALINEIEKICAYKQAGKVVSEDVELLVHAEREPNIFDLIDAIGEKNNSRAVQLLYKNLASGQDPYYLFAIMGGHFRNLLCVRDLIGMGESPAAIAKKTGIHPFVVSKISRNIKNFSTEDLRNKYQKLLSIDLGVKRGELNIVDSLYGLIVS